MAGSSGPNFIVCIPTFKSLVSKTAWVTASITGRSQYLNVDHFGPLKMFAQFPSDRSTATILLKSISRALVVAIMTRVFGTS